MPRGLVRFSLPAATATAAARCTRICSPSSTEASQGTYNEHLECRGCRYRLIGRGDCGQQQVESAAQVCTAVNAAVQRRSVCRIRRRQASGKDLASAAGQPYAASKNALS